MSHRVIIYSAVKAVLQSSTEVREELTTSQLAKVDTICAQADPCDEDFRYLTRRLNQAYCQED